MKNYTQEERIAINKKILKWFSVPFGILFGLIIISMITDSGKPKKVEEIKVEKVLTAEEIKANKIKKLFSAWDGSSYALNSYIKNNMNDPKSFEHVQTVWDEIDGQLIVTTTFRGKNGFGGMVKETVRASMDFEGNILALEKIN